HLPQLQGPVQLLPPGRPRGNHLPHVRPVTGDGGPLMTWFRVDDSFYDHPKMYDAPDCAVALWTRAGSWSARSLTDGFVPTGMLARFTSDHATAARELVHRGMWERVKGGYRFHDWHDYQPTREAVEKERKHKAERQRRWREAKRRRQRDGPVD